MSTFDEKTELFLNFLREKGVKISPKVMIEDYRQNQQGRGLKAVEDIEEDEVLFSISPNAMLRVSTNPELKVLCVKHSLDDWSSLIVRMMAAAESPDWKPYFEVLPTEFNTPMFWSKEETEELLKGSLLSNKVGRDQADELYDELNSGILSEPFFAGIPRSSLSRESFHRMGSLIMSYAFDVPEENDEEGGKAMVPLADMLNSHSVFTNAHLTFPEDPDNRVYEMVASKNIKKGQQIYNIYDVQPSSSLMRRYGYVELGGSPLECVEVLLETIISHAKSQGIENIESRLDKFESFIDDKIESFDISMSREISDGCDHRHLEIEFEPELLILSQILVSPALDGKSLRRLVSMAENQMLLTGAKNLLEAALQERRTHYGEVPPLEDLDDNQTKVLLDRHKMCTHIRQIELKVLDYALDWLTGMETLDKLS